MKIIHTFFLLGLLTRLLLIPDNHTSYISNNFSCLGTREKQKKSMYSFFSRAPPKVEGVEGDLT